MNCHMSVLSSSVWSVSYSWSLSASHGVGFVSSLQRGLDQRPSAGLVAAGDGWTRGQETCMNGTPRRILREFYGRILLFSGCPSGNL